jgi:mevalonate kinase
MMEAQGKVILFGEHAVVYGHSALAVGVPHAVQVMELVAQPKGIHLRIPGWSLAADQNAEGMLGAVLRKLGDLLPGGGDAGMALLCEANIPPGAGLGSSAALAVCLVRALAELRQVNMEDVDLCALAYELEKVFHGTPSGLDNTLATYGGLCLFNAKGLGSREGAVRLGEKVLALPYQVPTLLLCDSGRLRSTKDQVEKVRDRWVKDAAAVEKLFDEMDECLCAGLDALAAGRVTSLGASMIKAQRCLKQLGVSCDRIDQLVASALSAGAVGAKLTGAGGGGCVVAVAPGFEQAVLNAWRALGLSPWSFDPSPGRGQKRSPARESG